MKSIRALDLEGKVTVIGIAKRLEEIFFPDDPVPALVNKKSESLKLIQQARDEAHRFAITFHRNQRSKNFIRTELTEIPGIGAKTSEKLLQHFGSLARVRDADPALLEELIGKAQPGRWAHISTQKKKNRRVWSESTFLHWDRSSVLHTYYLGCFLL